MQYREFGKTGEKISALGFGCMRFPEYEENGQWYVEEEKTSAMLRLAYEKGVNYFDTAPFYCNKNSERALGKGVKEFRDKILLSTKLPLELVKKPEDYRRTLEASLARLGTDYIDFYHFWGINRKVFDEHIMAMDLLAEAQKAKEVGLIRHISFSFHDDPSAIKHIIDGSAKRGIPMESMLVQYNLLDRSNEAMLAYAHEQGLGTVAMGPVGGGRLSAPTDLYTRLTGKPAIATYELAFKFVLGNPNLSCALSGMQTWEMVEKNVAIAAQSRNHRTGEGTITPSPEDSAEAQAEWAQLGEAMEQLTKFNELYCTGCKYCQPCPVGIDIPHIFGLYTYYNVYGLKDYAQEGYRNYRAKPEGKTHKDCKDCGLCETKCPQHLKIRAQLALVEEVLHGGN